MKKFEEIEDFATSLSVNNHSVGTPRKRKCLLLQVGTNDVTNNVNLLNSVQKMVKKVNDPSPILNLSFQVSSFVKTKSISQRRLVRQISD